MRRSYLIVLLCFGLSVLVGCGTSQQDASAPAGERKASKAKAEEEKASIRTELPADAKPEEVVAEEPAPAPKAEPKAPHKKTLAKSAEKDSITTMGDAGVQNQGILKSLGSTGNKKTGTAFGLGNFGSAAPMGGKDAGGMGLQGRAQGGGGEGRGRIGNTGARRGVMSKVVTRSPRRARKPAAPVRVLERAENKPSIALNVQDREASATGGLRGLLDTDETNLRTPRGVPQKRAARPFITVKDKPLSTFSVDVDTASYATVRNQIRFGNLPYADQVRIEEMINYFDYGYDTPNDEHPFAVHVETSQSPWTPQAKLVKVGLKGREIKNEKRPASNLVFLIDVSGSMSGSGKLPLLKKGLSEMIGKLTDQDRVSIVVYAGASGLVLDGASGGDSKKIINALERLKSGGSTNGGAGIELAYNTAQKHLIKGGVNRVILATDGDFNVGITNKKSLVSLVKAKAKNKIFLSAFRVGNSYGGDQRMEEISNKGNGTYAYLDTFAEARKIFRAELNGGLVNIAKDVKIQIEFNPANVGSYRLIGYDNRRLAARDFNDDKKDAGDISAGHDVTAIYEVLSPGVTPETAGVDPLRYQQPKPVVGAEGSHSNEMLTLKLRYKHPEGTKSKLLIHRVDNDVESFESSSLDMKFAVSVATVGLYLRGELHEQDMISEALDWARQGEKVHQVNGDRSEFLAIVERLLEMSDANHTTAQR